MDKRARERVGELHKAHAGRLERLEALFGAAEALDDDAGAQRAHGGGKARDAVGQRDRVGLLHLEQHAFRGHAGGVERFGEERGEGAVHQRLRRQVDREAGDAAARGQAPQHLADHPAVELGHHAVVLEQREELSRRAHGLLLLVQAHQHLRHRIANGGAKGADRLAVERERVLRERLAQMRDRIAPMLLGIHALASLQARSRMLRAEHRPGSPDCTT